MSNSHKSTPSSGPNAARDASRRTLITTVIIGSVAAVSLAVWLLVTGGSNSAIPMVESNTPEPAPSAITTTSIIRQPQDTRIAVAGKKQLSVEIQAPGKVTYKWFRLHANTWVHLIGQTKARLTVAGTSHNNNARYRVEVAGPDRTVTSEIAQIKVVQPTQTPVKDYLSRTVDERQLIKGVDVSKWNHRGDMAALKRADWSFLAAKAGGSDRGHIYRDVTYTDRINRARSAGLKVAHYWFNGGNDPEKAAKAFVGYLHSAHPNDPIVLDVEPWHNKHGKLQDPWNPKQVKQFLDKVRQLRPDSNLFVYMTEQLTLQADWSKVSEQARLWVASWRDDVGLVPALAPSVGFWNNWTIWQYSSYGRPAGFGYRRVDVNIASADAWK